MEHAFRYYQEEANNAIYNELQLNNKCFVKMFCGTGKSLVMRYCKIAENKKLCVYVFPSLALIEQFYNDYLHDYNKKHLLKYIIDYNLDDDSVEDFQSYMERNIK